MMDVRQLLEPLVEHAAPPPPYETLARRVGARRRRRRVGTAVVAVLAAALVVPAALWATSSEPSTVETRPRTLTAPPVPDGWKPVTFGPVQFAVPADWPVYAVPQCIDHSTNGVYLVMAPDGCPGTTLSALIVQVWSYVGDGSEHPTETTINGLRARVREPEGVEHRPDRYSVALLDEDVLLEISFLAVADRTVAAEIVDTIGPAPAPAPIPAGPPPVPATPRPAPSEYCTATQVFRLSGMIEPSGAIIPDALPYFRWILDAAPAEIRPAVETMVAWLEQGAAPPAPPDVALQLTQDWTRRCSVPNAIQVLYTEQTRARATELTEDLRAEGYDTVPPGPVPDGAGSGNVLRCIDDELPMTRSGPTDALRERAADVTVEPLPKPLPEGYDPNASCWLVLGV